MTTQKPSLSSQKKKKKKKGRKYKKKEKHMGDIKYKGWSELGWVTWYKTPTLYIILTVMYLGLWAIQTY